MNTKEELIVRALYFLAQLIAIYINYKIAKHLIKFGIDYFFEKRYNYFEYKEGKAELNDIEADLRRHQDI